MKILIINSGSSSIKFQLLEMPSETLLCSGLAERIGTPDAAMEFNSEGNEIRQKIELKNHREGLRNIVEHLLDPDHGGVRDKKEIEAVGHRVVHGGNAFSDPTIIDEDVKVKIRHYADLAPLHNPHNLEGILVAEEFFPAAKQVAVFDTEFHQTIPGKAKKYAIPNGFYTNHGIQVYGFHGISHKYVSERAIEYLGSKKSNIITIHLGNGCSMTAVKDGKSVDHSMGFSPNQGLIMGTRSGDIDLGVIFHMIEHMGYAPDDANTLLTKKSGMLGLTGYTDLRDIESRALKGDAACSLALEMNAYRIRKYIGAYTASMNGLDAVVFTAGIGENSVLMRKLVCTELDYLGLKLDEEKNKSEHDGIREINFSSSQVKILVIPTNEELEIARQVYEGERS